MSENGRRELKKRIEKKSEIRERERKNLSFQLKFRSIVFSAQFAIPGKINGVLVNSFHSQITEWGWKSYTWPSHLLLEELSHLFFFRLNSSGIERRKKWKETNQESLDFLETFVKALVQWNVDLIVDGWKKNERISCHVTIMKWFLSCDLITYDTFNHSKSSLPLSLSLILSCLQPTIFFFFFTFKEK